VGARAEGASALTLTQLHYFLAAVTAGSLTRAADELSIAQPTLSEQIRKLERTLGVALFTRGPQGLTLTEAGRRFLPHAQTVIRDVDAAAASTAGIRDLEVGSVEFGMFNSGQYVLSGLIPAFRSSYPNITVRMIGANSAQVADDVRSGRLEAGVVALPIDARGLNIGDVLWSCEAAYFHADPAATRVPVSIDALLERPLVLPESGFAHTDPTRRQLSERAQQLGLELVPDIEVETGAAALAIAASGVAGAVASVPVAEALGYTEQLASASLDPPLIETFALIARDATNLSPGTRAMIGLVEEHMRMLHRAYQP
jgi:LysR family transcriptional regulator, cyn operon transcriptional activator